ncbi:MAG TPA: UvrB/UvrC motif-containing protein [Acidobacteriaceae bacterium]|nr:UvrB/UvrC motif-containing protein [Acidobacteriaceae bacterium]
MLQHSLDIPVDGIDAWLQALPSRAAVFALFGADEHSEPYIAKTANLRRRMQRLLAPSFAGSKRLHLGGRAVRLAYSEVGSEFATALLLLQSVRRYCSERVREHLHLHPPALLRMAAENAYPRVYVTNRVTQRTLACTYGPFPSRAVAERYLDDSLNFFELRRCTEELHPDPQFPGCIYSEMKMCLAPCFRGCTDERYAEEARQVREYFASRGAWTIAQCERERDAASAELDFEKAARLHQRVQKLKSVAQEVAPLVHPLAELDAVIVQPAVRQEIEVAQRTEKMSNRAIKTEASEVALYLVRGGRIAGPGRYSVEGMRHPNERAGSTSLFAHPTMLEPTPLDEPPAAAAVPAAPAKLARGVLEQRLQAVLDALENELHATKVPAEQLAEHLGLLARWYYRRPARRTGEIFFREETRDSRRAGQSVEENMFPLSRILRGISRVFCGQKEQSQMAEPVSAGSPGGPR